MTKPWPADAVERRSIDSLIPYAKNSRTHSDEQVAQISASMKEWGWTNPILIDETGSIIAGHGRMLAARKLGYTEAPVMVAEGWTKAQKAAYIIADNKLALNAGWDVDMLRLELGELEIEGFDLLLTGFSLEEINALSPAEESDQPSSGSGSLAGKFMLPPFSVMNAREGWWQSRKRAWLALGIKSELGRGQNGFDAAPGGSPMVSGYTKDGQRLTGLKNIGNKEAANG